MNMPATMTVISLTTDFMYVESEPEDTDNEDENNTGSDEYSETAEQHQNSDSDTVTCQQCNFKAKNKSGLRFT